MAGYEDTRQKIISTLMGRPNGTEIQPENHQDYALNMLDYIRSLELIATSTLIGVAESNSTPVQPNASRVCYIAGVAQNQTVVFENFIDENGNPISVTTGDMEGVFIILLWNTQYWSAQTFSTNIISQSESATLYYRYNIRKTYESIALMNDDVASPIGTDGKYIKIGDIVTVVNSTTPSENGIYSYEGTTDGWKYQSSFNFQLSQTTGSDPNVSMSQKAITKALNIYNVTSLYPLPSGFYEHSTAILAIPSGERTLGLIITYETASGVWYTERFTGTDIANWGVAANWEKLPDAGDLAQLRSDLNEIEQEQIQGGVYDVSSHNDGAVFESLSVLLASDNLSTLIPTSVRRGGMSIRFIQGSVPNSDNKYIQARCMAQNFTTDITQWSISEEGVYVENPEFVYVKTDKDNKILWGIKIDGEFFFGAGCPQQVKDYIEEKISSLSLDEYEDIVALLSDYLGSDTTLKAMIDSINERIPEIIESPEWLQVTTDSQGKILEGITPDGKKVMMDVDVQGNEISTIDNPEWSSVITDIEGKVLSGIRKNGAFVCNNIEITKPAKFDYFPHNKYEQLMRSMKRREIVRSTGRQSENYRTLVLEAITDTHNDNKAIENFLSFNATYGIYADAMVHFGDLIQSEFVNPYDHPAIDGYEKILLCLGNHDAYIQNHHSFSDVVSAEDCYDRYFKGSIEDWGVSYTQNLCYYYKDFTYYNGNGELRGIRYIVLDCMHWDEAQKEWLADILYGNNSNSAIDKGLQVIAVQHVPCAGMEVSSSDYAEGMNFFECTFNPKDKLSINHTYNYDSLAIIAEFQQRGGIFITWIFGHWHVDGIGKYVEYPNQMFIVQAVGGGAGMGSWSDTERVNRTESENQFSVYSFDIEKKYIRILRVGAEYDRNLQHKKTLSISYGGLFDVISNY